MDAANRSVAHQFAAELIEFDGPLLTARLQDPFIFAYGRDELATFADGEGHGLFEIDIFASLAGVYCGERMPVIGRRNDDGIHITRLEHLAVILICAGLELGGHLFRGGQEAVGHGHDLRVVGQASQLAGASSGADVTHAHAIIGSGPDGGAENLARHEIGQGQQAGPLGRTTKKTAA